jgi:hypothetical protein
MEPYARLFASNPLIVASANLFALIAGFVVAWKFARWLGSAIVSGGKLTTAVYREYFRRQVEHSAADVTYFVALVAAEVGALVTGSFIVIVLVVTNRFLATQIVAAFGYALAVLWLIIILLTFLHLLNLCGGVCKKRSAKLRSDRRR